MPGPAVTTRSRSTDTGQTPYTGAAVTDELAGVLDDAAYNGDAAATAGEVSYAAPTLTWTGEPHAGRHRDHHLLRHRQQPRYRERILASTVTSTAPGSNCLPTGIPNAECTATVDVTPGPLTMSAPDALTWTAILDGQSQSVSDPVASDRTYSVSDFSGTGAGWTVTAEATPFAVGTDGPVLPTAGTFYTNGDPSDESSITAPTSACASNSSLQLRPRPPTPSPIRWRFPSQPAAPPSQSRYTTRRRTAGTGAITIGNVGWWLNIPSSTQAGVYRSTITLTLSSGP